MSGISAEKLKELREKTGVKMMDCKVALELHQGDIEKAIQYLREKGMMSGAKKEGRETKEGIITFAESADSIALVEGNSETDFVASNETFIDFMKDIAAHAAQTKPVDLAAMNSQPFYKDSKITTDQHRNLMIQTLGENIQFGRMQVIHKDPSRSYGIYSHMGGKIVVVVEIEGASDQSALAREIGMHAAAENPEFLKPEEIPATIRAREEEIARAQVEGKPANIVDKIVAGKVKAFEEQSCLTKQKYIKDNSVTVEQFVEAAGKQLGKKLSVRCFWRWKVGA